MAELEALFTRYDQLVVFDTETTGLYPNRDEIIEFSAAVLERKDGLSRSDAEYDNLVALSPAGLCPLKFKPHRHYQSGFAGTWNSQDPAVPGRGGAHFRGPDAAAGLQCPF